MIFMGASYGNVRNPAICQRWSKARPHIFGGMRHPAYTRYGAGAPAKLRSRPELPCPISLTRYSTPPLANR